MVSFKTDQYGYMHGFQRLKYNIFRRQRLETSIQKWIQRPCMSDMNPRRAHEAGACPVALCCPGIAKRNSKFNA